MYKSPLHILSDMDASPEEFTDSVFLLRLRKKLLAEFNLTNSPTIEIKGKQYSKDEVIKTIDVLMSNPQMPLHLFIFSNKTILDFLENDNSKIHPSELKVFYVPDEIKVMLNPLLLERFIYNLKKAFHSRKFDSATALLINKPSGLSEEESSIFNEEINKNIVNLQEHIQSVGFSHIHKMPTELDYLKKNSLAVFLNALPVDFIDSINSLVGDIINTMVSYQKTKKHDKAYLYYVSNILIKIKCDEELIRLIKNNHQAFLQNYEGKSGSTGDFSLGRVLYILFFVLIFIARVSTCSKSNDFSTSKLNFNNITISEESKSEYEEFDSYRRYITDTNNLKEKNTSKNNLVFLDSTLSGNNPFKHILYRTSDYDYTDTSLQRVIINNKSGYHLIITTFDYYNAKSYFFFNTQPDTLSFKKGDKLCLYFGNWLSVNESGKNNQIYESLNMKSILNRINEVYFKQTNNKLTAVMQNNYNIELKRSKNAKQKKKNPLPTIVFDANFFEKNSFENNKIKLMKDTLMN